MSFDNVKKNRQSKDNMSTPFQRKRQNSLQSSTYPADNQSCCDSFIQKEPYFSPHLVRAEGFHSSCTSFSKGSELKVHLREITTLPDMPTCKKGTKIFHDLHTRKCWVSQQMWTLKLGQQLLGIATNVNLKEHVSLKESQQPSHKPDPFKIARCSHKLSLQKVVYGANVCCHRLNWVCKLEMASISSGWSSLSASCIWLQEDE